MFSEMPCKTIVDIAEIWNNAMECTAWAGLLADQLRDIQLLVFVTWNFSIILVLVFITYLLSRLQYWMWLVCSSTQFQSTTILF